MLRFFYFMSTDFCIDYIGNFHLDKSDQHYEYNLFMVNWCLQSEALGCLRFWDGSSQG